MSQSTISGTVNVSVTINTIGPIYGVGNYPSPLTILSAGYIEPSLQGQTGVDVNGGTLLNEGIINGGINGGVGVFLPSSLVTNEGTILGGYGAAQATGVSMFGGTLTNGRSGVIEAGNGAGGGSGVSLTNGLLTNFGTIIGQGFVQNSVVENSGTLLNYGLITGLQSTGYALDIMGAQQQTIRLSMGQVRSVKMLEYLA
ncbi:hypothetical protein AruPA_03540 [Acidiphilium sp. PA]|uniref:hypothetical protein n=1 Tax=Acidiphilium sp. PA TaxID=2871705 RepID=UPI00224378AA|nr:hypothetical protein [Acidiphilium sp. PA]MCW8306101.1 hypothetical protein [Acidiphilium sp. PA]